MPRTNRACNYCGKPYYVCRACIDINSWKNVCCSVECFMKMNAETDKAFKPLINERGKVNMQGVLKDTKETVEITGYDISLGRFDCKIGDKILKTSLIDDFDSFTLTPEELKELINK